MSDSAYTPARAPDGVCFGIGGKDPQIRLVAVRLEMLDQHDGDGVRLLAVPQAESRCAAGLSGVARSNRSS